jgi:hypothetical protein
MLLRAHSRHSTVSSAPESGQGAERTGLGGLAGVRVFSTEQTLARVRHHTAGWRRMIRQPQYGSRKWTRLLCSSSSSWCCCSAAADFSTDVGCESHPQGLAVAGLTLRSAPSSRCRRQLVRCDEYSPSRRSSVASGSADGGLPQCDRVPASRWSGPVKLRPASVASFDLNNPPPDLVAARATIGQGGRCHRRAFC